MQVALSFAVLLLGYAGVFLVLSLTGGKQSDSNAQPGCLRRIALATSAFFAKCTACLNRQAADAPQLVVEVPEGSAAIAVPLAEHYRADHPLTQYNELYVLVRKVRAALSCDSAVVNLSRFGRCAWSASRRC